jgi:hypothetical protein
MDPANAVTLSSTTVNSLHEVYDSAGGEMKTHRIRTEK